MMLDFFFPLVVQFIVLGIWMLVFLFCFIFPGRDLHVAKNDFELLIVLLPPPYSLDSTCAHHTQCVQH